MLEEENRNCGCMMHHHNNTNIVAYTTNNNMNTCECEEFNQTREEMMSRIKGLNFAIIELGLYLDTHVDDEKALCLHRKYCKEYRELTDKYQKVLVALGGIPMEQARIAELQKTAILLHVNPSRSMFGERDGIKLLTRLTRQSKKKE